MTNSSIYAAVVITNIYERHDLDQLVNLEGLLERFKDREVILIQELVRRYNISATEQSELGIVLDRDPNSTFDGPPPYYEAQGAAPTSHPVQAVPIMEFEKPTGQGVYPPIAPNYGNGTTPVQQSHPLASTRS